MNETPTRLCTQVWVGLGISISLRQICNLNVLLSPQNIRALHADRRMVTTGYDCGELTTGCDCGNADHGVLTAGVQAMVSRPVLLHGWSIPQPKPHQPHAHEALCPVHTHNTAGSLLTQKPPRKAPVLSPTLDHKSWTSRP